MIRRRYKVTVKAPDDGPVASRQYWTARGAARAAGTLARSLSLGWSVIVLDGERQTLIIRRYL